MNHFGLAFEFGEGGVEIGHANVEVNVITLSDQSDRWIHGIDLL